MHRRQAIALVCSGMLAGVSAAYAARSTPAAGWRPGTAGPAVAELASESGFYVRVEPKQVTRDGARERLTLAARVGTTREVGARSIASIQIEDDRGTIVLPAKVSRRMELGARTEIAGAEVGTAALPDGWYRLRAQAVFVDPGNPKEAVGSETDSLYLEVRQGEVYIVDMADWFAGSQANLGTVRP